jgi:hypothetical protein
MNDERVIHLVVPGAHYFMIAETLDEHEKWSDILREHTLTNSLKMDTETVGYRYYKQCPDRLAEYCEDWCNISTLEVAQYVTEGAHVVKLIYERPGELMAVSILFPSESSWDENSTIPTQQKHMIVLFWYFMARAAIYDELFTSGVFRFDDPDGKLFKFLAALDGTYER